MKFSQALTAATLAVGAQSAAILTDDTTYRLAELSKMTENNILNMRQMTPATIFVQMPRILNTYRNMISLIGKTGTTHENNFKRDCVFQGNKEFCDPLEGEFLVGETDTVLGPAEEILPLAQKRQVTGFGRKSDSESPDLLFQHDADHDDDVNDVRDALADDIADDIDQDGGLTKRQRTESPDLLFQHDADHDDDVNDVRDALADDIADDIDQDGGLTKRQRTESPDLLFQHDADHDNDVNDVRDSLADDVADDADQDGGLTKRQVPAKVLSAAVQKSVCDNMANFFTQHSVFLQDTINKANFISASPFNLPLATTLRYFQQALDKFGDSTLVSVPTCSVAMTAEALSMSNLLTTTINAVSGV